MFRPPVVVVFREVFCEGTLRRAVQQFVCTKCSVSDKRINICVTIQNTDTYIWICPQLMAETCRRLHWLQCNKSTHQYMHLLVISHNKSVVLDCSASHNGMSQNKTNSECFEYQTGAPGRQYILTARHLKPRRKAVHTTHTTHTPHTMYDAQHKQLPNKESTEPTISTINNRLICRIKSVTIFNQLIRKICGFSNFRF